MEIRSDQTGITSEHLKEALKYKLARSGSGCDIDLESNLYEHFYFTLKSLKLSKGILLKTEYSCNGIDYTEEVVFDRVTASFGYDAAVDLLRGVVFSNQYKIQYIITALICEFTLGSFVYGLILKKEQGENGKDT